MLFEFLLNLAVSNLNKPKNITNFHILLSFYEFIWVGKGSAGET